MKGGLVATLHALGAVRAAAGFLPGDVVLQAVSSEEDGGQGTVAALDEDAAFAGCLIPEPTGLDVGCAHAGSVQLEGIVRGRAAHAALPRQGLSALDRYLPLHQALAEHERSLSADVRHPLVRQLELPYPRHPCVMVRPSGIERAHGVDEWVDVGERAVVARAIARRSARLWSQA